MDIEIINFRPFLKNSLQGFLTLRLIATGLEIRDIALHEKNESRWLSLPSKPYQKKDGTQAWSYILEFTDKEKSKQFQAAALEALDLFRRGQNEK